MALGAGKHRIGARNRVTCTRGDVVPVIDSLPAQRNADWLRPLGSGKEHPLYASLSLILAICLGTMGLPHVLVRFYTNPDGRDARRTTLVVIVLLSSFYLLPTLFGALGRHYVPDLLLTGNTDATVLLLPQRMLGGLPGLLLGALVTAGAFAAFLSTASGLTVSVAGVLSQDVLHTAPASGSARPRGRSRIRSFRVSAVVAIGVPYLLSLPSQHLGLAAVVGLAFALAASTFCPLLVLGVWWRRLTDVGAVAGLVVGGLLATTGVLVTVIGRSGPRLARRVAGAACCVGRAIGVCGDGARLAADPAPAARQRGTRDGAPARPRIAGGRNCIDQPRRGEGGAPSTVRRAESTARRTVGNRTATDRNVWRFRTWDCCALRPLALVRRHRQPSGASGGRRVMGGSP